ncbi:hypothetical protein P280DRAFT_484644 [Massarina eburnea CBS 473.64]|uniref:Uncharacterized protein n=1 Tax=Massarina eburnea CBS 473.64 TaxID=1395130 RepID=A0A6A6RJP7_9PLEO|nr:hypothetical protein P280DRAFT_484644 [Massarina eburnea CBS 473.64]
MIDALNGTASNTDESNGIWTYSDNNLDINSYAYMGAQDIYASFLLTLIHRTLGDNDWGIYRELACSLLRNSFSTLSDATDASKSLYALVQQSKYAVMLLHNDLALQLYDDAPTDLPHADIPSSTSEEIRRIYFELVGDFAVEEPREKTRDDAITYLEIWRPSRREGSVEDGVAGPLLQLGT